MIAIKNIKIVTHKLLENQTLVIDKDKIKEILPSRGDYQGFEELDGEGRIAVPGFIDTHVHGGNGFDCNDGTEEALEEIGEFYLSRGVTSYYPTLSVDPLPVLRRSFHAIRKIKESPDDDRSEILGSHFESPFISLKHKGCQAENRILELSEKTYPIIEKNKDIIKRITLAPEIGNHFNYIKKLKQSGIVISAGHSDATAEILRRSAAEGVTMVTHLYNAMASVRKRGPFRQSMFLEEALTNDNLYCEIIADGIHVTPEQIQMAYRCKGPDKLLVCSDANRGAGAPSGKTLYTCGQEAIVENGVAMLKDRSSLASSVTPMDEMFKYLVQRFNIPIADAVKMTSTTPAAMMGVANKKGSLKPGFDADILLMDENLDITSVIKKGKFV